MPFDLGGRNFLFDKVWTYIVGDELYRPSSTFHRSFSGLKKEVGNEKWGVCGMDYCDEDHMK